MDSIDIKITNDGSPTLFSEKFQATYHSSHGALTESSLVFIHAGLEYCAQTVRDKIRVFEMGFGTGFNAHLTYLWHLAQQRPVEYSTIEAFPVSKEIWIPFSSYFKDNEQDTFRHWHELDWDIKHEISHNFNFLKLLGRIENFHPEHKMDLIFYDAFGPNTQPELWEENILHTMYQTLDSNGVLVTYCAKGEFKRTLKRIGFIVESLPGPPGKREIVRAIKTNSSSI